MSVKPVAHAERVEVYYDKQQWQFLKVLRSRVTEIIEVLERAKLTAVTHGSVARGDVTSRSDIDVFVPNPPSSFFIEATLGRADIQLARRFVIQATPRYAVKGYLEIGERETVSFPLAKMRRVERDFYRFSGEISLEMLKEDRRVAGVDKRLMLIEPTEKGHVECTIAGREEETARILGISAETVFDRVHALLRRSKIGRTGMFIKKELSAGETFEMVVKELAETRPEVRRRLKYG